MLYHVQPLRTKHSYSLGSNEGKGRILAVTTILCKSQIYFVPQDYVSTPKVFQPSPPLAVTSLEYCRSFGKVCSKKQISILHNEPEPRYQDKMSLGSTRRTRKGKAYYYYAGKERKAGTIGRTTPRSSTRRKATSSRTRTSRTRARAARRRSAAGARARTKARSRSRGTRSRRTSRSGVRSRSRSRRGTGRSRRR